MEPRFDNGNIYNRSGFGINHSTSSTERRGLNVGFTDPRIRLYELSKSLSSTGQCKTYRDCPLSLAFLLGAQRCCVHMQYRSNEITECTGGMVAASLSGKWICPDKRWVRIREQQGGKIDEVLLDVTKFT